MLRPALVLGPVLATGGLLAAPQRGGEPCLSPGRLAASCCMLGACSNTKGQPDNRHSSCPRTGKAFVAGLLGGLTAPREMLEPVSPWNRTEARRGGIVPWITLAILAALLATFAAELLAPATPSAEPGSPSVPTLLALGAMNGELIAAGEWHRLFTANLLHAGPGHILANGTALLLFGWLLEPLLGRAWFFVAFCAGGLSGSLMSFAAHPTEVTSTGASGAILGLFAAGFLASFRLPRRSDARGRLQFCSLAVLLPALLPTAASAGENLVDYAGHVGGALGGALIGLTLWQAWPEAARLPSFRRAAAAGSVAGVTLYLASVALVALRFEDSPFRHLIPPGVNADAQGRADADALVRRYPADPRGYVSRALAAYGAGDMAAAEAGLRAALRRAEAIKPLFDAAYRNHLRADLALVLLNEGRRRDAAATLRPACDAPAADAALLSALRSRGLCGRPGS